MRRVVEQSRMEAALRTAVAYLLQQRHPDGYWEGRLSSSALSAATAISALALARQESDQPLIHAGLAWLCATQGADGGWGDTTDSPSNLSTTLLTVSALRLAGAPPETTAALARAEAYLTAQAGETVAARVATINRLYGKDRTFAVPILMNCALAGLVPWEGIPGLPFELAAVPPDWYKTLRLHVVSYALPALIAVGLLLHHHHPPANPLVRWIRQKVTRSVLAKLKAIQPEHGGYLDATPLTSFVAMSLLPLHGHTHPVIYRCLHFVRASARADGSWPIDTNLSVWMTTNALSALASADGLVAVETDSLRAWLAARQYTEVHPFTNAAPGGWGWTHLPGGVPDADDTPGAMLALARLGERSALAAGARWLLGLQNADGGWPTFCKGWGQLPFDKSSPDVTAHALRALREVDPAQQDAQVQRAIRQGFRYLAAAQRPDGAWVPLWFGNQAAPARANPVLGTARALRAYLPAEVPQPPALAGMRFLLATQHPDGGWGGDAGVPATIEETALAVTGLCGWRDRPEVAEAIARGAAYLVARVEDGTWTTPAPIGLYFANLWYAEALYPVVWTIEALGQVCHGGEAQEKSNR